MEASRPKSRSKTRSRSRSRSRSAGSKGSTKEDSPPDLAAPPAAPSLSDFAQEEEGPTVVLIGAETAPPPMIAPAVPSPPSTQQTAGHATPDAPALLPPPYITPDEKPPIVPHPESLPETATPSTSASTSTPAPATPPTAQPGTSSPTLPPAPQPTAPGKEQEAASPTSAGSTSASPSLAATSTQQRKGKSKVRTLVATHDAGLGVDADSTLKASNPRAEARRWIWYANRQHVEALDVSSFLTRRHFPTDQKAAMLPGNSAIAALVHNDSMVFAAAGELVWARPVDRPETDLSWDTIWEMKIGGWGPHGLALDGKDLYVACRTPGETASQKHIVAALEAETGDMKWAAQFSQKQQDWGYPIDATSLSDVVLVGQSEKLIALTKDTGKIKWEAKFKSAGKYPPTWVVATLPPSLASDQPIQVLIVSSGRYIYRVRPETGDVLENAYKGGVVMTNSPSSLAVHPRHPDVVYVRDGSTQKLHCMKVKSTFEKLWEWSCKFPSGDSSPFEGGGVLYIEKPTSFYNGEVTCLYERQGWTRFIKSKLTIRRFVLQGKRLAAFFPGENALRRRMLISDEPGNLELSENGRVLTIRGSELSETKQMVLHFDTTQAAAAWKDKVEASVKGAEPTPHEGPDVIVVNGTGILQGVDPESGAEMWRSSQIWSPSQPGFPMMGMYYDRASGYLLTSTGYKIRALDPVTGAELMKVALDKVPSDNENIVAPFSQRGNESTSSQPFAHAQFTERLKL